MVMALQYLKAFRFVAVLSPGTGDEVELPLARAEWAAPGVLRLLRGITKEPARPTLGEIAAKLPNRDVAIRLFDENGKVAREYRGTASWLCSLPFGGLNALGTDVKVDQEAHVALEGLELHGISLTEVGLPAAVQPFVPAPVARSIIAQLTETEAEVIRHAGGDWLRAGLIYDAIRRAPVQRTVLDDLIAKKLLERRAVAPATYEYRLTSLGIFIAPDLPPRKDP